MHTSGKVVQFRRQLVFPRVSEMFGRVPNTVKRQLIECYLLLANDMHAFCTTDWHEATVRECTKLLLTGDV